MIVRGRHILNPSSDKKSESHNALYLKNGVIKDIGEFDTFQKLYPGEKIVGSENQLIMPGFIDAHTHGSGLSFFQRGEEYDFLENALLTFECALNIEPDINAMLNAVRHIKNGCTTIHHNNWTMPFDQNEIIDSVKKINAYYQTGIRLGFSVGTRIKNILAYDDNNFVNTLPRELQKQVSHLVNIDEDTAISHYFNIFEYLFDKYKDDRIRIFFGPNWVQGSTDKFLQKIKQRSDELGKIPIHIHTLQTPIQKAYGLRTYGKSLVGHLADLGLVDSNLVLGHAVYLDNEDIDLLAQHHSSVTHHPSCNLIMRNGIAPVYQMMQKGLNVALGIDEKGINDDEDPIMEMRMIYFLHRISGFHLTNTPALTADDVLQISTRNGSRVTGYGDELGLIEIGKPADIILIDLDDILYDPWIEPTVNYSDIIVRRALGRHVNTVIINGEVVMEDRELLTVDVEALYKEAVKQAEHGKNEMQIEYGKLLSRIKPYYQAWYNDWLENLHLDPFYVLNSRI